MVSNPSRRVFGKKNGAISSGIVLVFGAITLLVLGGLIFGKNFIGQTANLIDQSLEDVFSGKGATPVFEIALEGSFRLPNISTTSDSGDKKEDASGLPVAKSENRPEKNKTISSLGGSRVSSSPSSASLSAGGTTTSQKNIVHTPIANEDPVLPVPQVAPVCDFSGTLAPSHTVLVSEIAWMGGSGSTNDEWMELKNNISDAVHLARWQLINQSGGIKIVFKSNAQIKSGGLYLLERSDDVTVPNIAADAIYSGALSNSGEWLKLFDDTCRLVDELDASSGWGATGGDNTTKQTLERNTSDLAWHTSVISGGTPRAHNSLPSSSSPAPQPSSPPPASPTPPPNPSPPPLPIPPPVSSGTHIVISEILAGIDGNADYEFIELYNPTEDSINLAGWELRKQSSSGSESNVVDNGKFTGMIPAHGYFLIANPAYNGAPGADLLYSVTSAALAYTSNTVLLYSGDYVSSPVVDQVSWAEIPKDQSYTRDLATGNFALNANPTPQNAQNL